MSQITLKIFFLPIVLSGHLKKTCGRFITRTGDVPCESLALICFHFWICKYYERRKKLNSIVCMREWMACLPTRTFDHSWTRFWPSKSSTLVNATFTSINQKYSSSFQKLVLRIMSCNVGQTWLSLNTIQTYFYFNGRSVTFESKNVTATSSSLTSAPFCRSRW